MIGLIPRFRQRYAVQPACYLSAAAATSGSRDAQRKLETGEAEFSVTGASGEEYLVEMSNEDANEVVIIASEDVPVDTTVTVDAEGPITTVQSGTRHLLSFLRRERRG